MADEKLSMIENLSGHSNLEYLEGSNIKDLVEQLRQITLPFKILATFTIGTRPTVILSLTRPIKKTKKEG